MTSTAPSRQELEALLPFATEAQAKHIRTVLEYGSVRAADKAGLPRRTIQRAITAARAAAAAAPAGKKAPVTLPEFPDDDISVDEIRAQMMKRFEKRQTHHKAKQWFPIKVNIKGPIGVTFWGDPHVDDDGCAWPLLNHHCDLHRDTEGLFSVNIGDTTNNWIGRLVRLYAHQETSAKTAGKLAKWFMCDSGVKWIAVLLGNHGMWGDFGSFLRALNAANIPMDDWQAQFRLVFPNGREVRVWASHDFAGNSMWNSLHGPQRAAHTKAEAHIFACGHKHNWAIQDRKSVV